LDYFNESHYWCPFSKILKFMFWKMQGFIFTWNTTV
jgi:hypothetical protein